MKCDFCKRDADEIKDIFSPIFAKINEKIKDLEKSIQIKKQRYAQENGFIKENFDKVEKIDEFILKMKISTILGDLSNFIEGNQNIKILIDYFTKYNSEIPTEKTLSDLLVLYKAEPTEKRKNEAVSDLSTQKNDLQKRHNEIEYKIEKFIDMEVDFNIPLNIFSFNDKTILYIIDDSKENIKHKIHLCPYCAFLFKDFSKEINKAREATYNGEVHTITDTNDKDSSLKDWDFD